MECADEHQHGSCSSQETWLSACETQCPSDSSHRSGTLSGTHRSGDTSDVRSNSSSRSSRQRWAPTTDAVAVARERLAAALAQGGSMRQQRHTYASDAAAHGSAALPVPAEQQHRHHFQHQHQQQKPRQKQDQPAQHGGLAAACDGAQPPPAAAGAGPTGLQLLDASSPQRHRSPRRSSSLAVATARVTRNLSGAFELADIRAARQSRRARTVCVGDMKVAVHVRASTGVATGGSISAATGGGSTMEDSFRGCVVQRTTSSVSDCSQASMDSGASDDTCFGAATAATTTVAAQPCTLAAATAEGRRFVAAPAVRTLVASVAGSLSALHGEAFVHCNVAADTILLDPRDWCTARLHCDGWAAQTGFAGSCMRSKLQLGSRTCCAPEVACCKRGPAAYTPAGDMWGLGMVLLGLVCGGPTLQSTMSVDCSPDGGMASLDGLQQHIAAQLTDLLHKAHAERHGRGEALLSAEVAEVLRSLLAADPAQRPAARRLLQHQWLRRPERTRNGRL